MVIYLRKIKNVVTSDQDKLPIFTYYVYLSVFIYLEGLLQIEISQFSEYNFSWVLTFSILRIPYCHNRIMVLQDI